MAHPVPQSARSQVIRGKTRLLSVQNHTSVFSLMCCWGVLYFRHNLYVKIIWEIIHPHQTGATLSHCMQTRSWSGRSSHVLARLTSFYRLHSASIIYCLWSLPRSLFWVPPCGAPHRQPQISTRNYKQFEFPVQRLPSEFPPAHHKWAHRGPSTQSLCRSFTSSRYLLMGSGIHRCMLCILTQEEDTLELSVRRKLSIVNV